MCFLSLGQLEAMSSLLEVIFLLLLCGQLYFLTFTKKIQVYFVMRAILLSMAAPSLVKYPTQTTVGCVYVVPYLCYTNPRPSIPHQEENLQFVSDDNLAVIRGDIVKLQQTSVSPVTHRISHRFWNLNIVNLSGNDPPRHVYQRHHHRFIFLSRSHPIL